MRRVAATAVSSSATADHRMAHATGALLLQASRRADRIAVVTASRTHACSQSGKKSPRSHATAAAATATTTAATTAATAVQTLASAIHTAHLCHNSRAQNNQPRRTEDGSRSGAAAPAAQRDAAIVRGKVRWRRARSNGPSSTKGDHADSARNSGGAPGGNRGELTSE